MSKSGNYSQRKRIGDRSKGHQFGVLNIPDDAYLKHIGYAPGSEKQSDPLNGLYGEFRRGRQTIQPRAEQ